MVAQRFEMITKAYETSQEKPPETKDVCPYGNITAKTSSVLVLLQFKCDLKPLRNHFSAYVKHATPGMNLPGDRGPTMG